MNTFQTCMSPLVSTAGTAASSLTLLSVCLSKMISLHSSHHASASAYGKLLNAFDLVRVHKFPDMDDVVSTNKMLEIANSNEKVKQCLAREREERACLDFSPDLISAGWKSKLTYMARSRLLSNSVHNMLLILNDDPEWAVFAYNEHAQQVERKNTLGTSAEQQVLARC